MGPDLFNRCADLINGADGILIAAGAGMGVDAGLPDFRGTEGFWRAYPALAKARIHFEDIASPDTFESDPRLAWGFYGHRLNLYRRTEPHEGHRILHRLSREMPKGAFVFTSNVDGLFQKASFLASQIAEVHGSIHHLQCMHGCWHETWTADGFVPKVDEANCRLESEIPTCPHCGGVARPNILMFGDAGWLDHRQRLQSAALSQWLLGTERILVIELGAGITIPTVRRMSESIGGPIIRINKTDATIGSGRGVSLQMGALEALRGIEEALDASARDYTVLDIEDALRAVSDGFDPVAADNLIQYFQRALRQGDLFPDRGALSPQENQLVDFIGTLSFPVSDLDQPVANHLVGALPRAVGGGGLFPGRSGLSGREGLLLQFLELVFKRSTEGCSLNCALGLARASHRPTNLSLGWRDLAIAAKVELLVRAEMLRRGIKGPRQVMQRFKRNKGGRLKSVVKMEPLYGEVAASFLIGEDSVEKIFNSHEVGVSAMDDSALALMAEYLVK